jgi:hypothetical protein
VPVTSGLSSLHAHRGADHLGEVEGRHGDAGLHRLVPAPAKRVHREVHVGAQHGAEPARLQLGLRPPRHPRAGPLEEEVLDLPDGDVGGVHRGLEGGVGQRSPRPSIERHPSVEGDLRREQRLRQLSQLEPLQTDVRPHAITALPAPQPDGLGSVLGEQAYRLE